MTVALAIEAVTKQYGGKVALHDVTVHVAAGEVRGVVGPNGAGKSTLLRLAMGLVQPQRGAVTVLGRGAPAPGPQLAGVAGLLDGMRWPREMTVRRLLRMLAGFDRAPVAVVDEALERLSIADQANRRIGTLSLGTVQRVGLAAAWMRHPRLLLLDEPMNGLDAAGRLVLRDLVRDLAQSGTAVAIASHDLPELAVICQTVTRLDKGRVEWTGDIAEVSQVGEHLVLVTTGDDVAASAVAASVEGLKCSAVEGGLVLRGRGDVLERMSVELGRAGIGIRHWEVTTDPAARRPRVDVPDAETAPAQRRWRPTTSGGEQCRES